MKCFLIVRANLWLIASAIWKKWNACKILNFNCISKTKLSYCIDNSTETLDQLTCNTLLAFAGTNMPCTLAYSIIVAMTQLFSIHFTILHVCRCMRSSIFLPHKGNLQYRILGECKTGLKYIIFGHNPSCCLKLWIALVSHDW